MPDIVDAQTRSRMMAGIRAGNTKPELLIRKALHGLGYRYRLHAAGVPGRPDIVLSRRRAAIFVHGCFWHGHDCALFRMPGTRREFWETKIERNRARDAEVRDLLYRADWRQATVWECAFRGPSQIGLKETITRLASWIDGEDAALDIRGARREAA